MGWPKGKPRGTAGQHEVTPEERQRASDRMRAWHEQRRLKNQQTLTGTATTRAAIPAEPVPYAAATPLPDYVPDTPPLLTEEKRIAWTYDWLNAPIDEVSATLANLRREYDRAAQIVLQRMSQHRDPLVCWTVEHQKFVSRKVLVECKRKIPDAGKAVFINNGYKENPSDPNEKVRSIYACSMLCYMAYQEYQSKIKAPRVL